MLKGTKSEMLENTGINLSYIDIPILAKFSLPTESEFVPYAFAGPSIGILLSAKYEVVNIEEDIKDETKNIDYGIVLGAGADYKIGAGCLLLDVRYSYGLTTIVDAEGDEDAEAKNTGIMFMIGYGYSF